MKLIEEIKTAYQVQNLRPVQDQFFFQPEGVDFAYACPIVALALHRNAVKRDDPDLALETSENPALKWMVQEFGEKFALGFMDGFDDEDANVDDSAYLEGNLKGGLLAQQILHDAGLS